MQERSTCYLQEESFTVLGCHRLRCFDLGTGDGGCIFTIHIRLTRHKCIHMYSRCHTRQVHKRGHANFLISWRSLKKILRIQGHVHTNKQDNMTPFTAVMFLMFTLTFYNIIWFTNIFNIYIFYFEDFMWKLMVSAISLPRLSFNVYFACLSRGTKSL